MTTAAAAAVQIFDELQRTGEYFQDVESEDQAAVLAIITGIIETSDADARSLLRESLVFCNPLVECGAEAKHAFRKRAEKFLGVE